VLFWSSYGAGTGTGTGQKSEPEPRGMMLIDVQDPMMESMEGSLRHHQLININGTQHIITSSKPLPDLKRLHNHHVEVLTWYIWCVVSIVEDPGRDVVDTYRLVLLRAIK
jgi:hypothetical protein